MTLSILIPTLPESKHYLDRIVSQLNPQITEGVEIVVDDRSRAVATGIKRNDMVTRARGEYVMHLDCDDNVTEDYIKKILEAIKKSGPDVVTFCGFMTTDGKHIVDWVIRLGERYEERSGKYYRFPNHLCAMKKDIARRVRFPEIWQGEDFKWACGINDALFRNGGWQPGPRSFLKTEEHIEKQIYHYDFILRKNGIHK